MMLMIMKSLRSFCPTRWMLYESSLTSMLEITVQELMKEISDSDKSESGSKAGGF